MSKNNSMRTCCRFPLLLPPVLVPLLSLPMWAPSRPVLFRPTPGTLCNHKAKAGKVSERDEKRAGPVPFCSVPFRPAPATVCNHEAKAGKVSEKDKKRVSPVLSLTVCH